MTDKMFEDDKLPDIRNLHDLIKKHLEEGEAVETYKSKSATAIGDNYGSTALAVEIIVKQTKNGSLRSLFTFCKMLPRDEITRQVFNVDVTFVKELQMYVLAVPAMLQLQRENSVPENDLITKITPMCYGGRKGLGDVVDDDALIILEDLRKRKYEIASRHVGVDHLHACLVMKRLAVFHALPIALKLKKPQIFKDTIMEAARFFKFGGEKLDGTADETKFIDITVANMKKWPELQNLVEVVREKCMEKISNGLPEGREPFATVIHNDLWINNMLFHYHDNKPDEVVFVDFQVTQYDSPLRDVIFFLFTSVQTKERKAHFDKLIEVYHSSFCSCLEQVGVDTTHFTLDAVWDEIRAVAHSEINHILTMLRFINADKEFVKEHSEDFAFHEDLGGHLYREKLKDVVLEFAARKWI